MYEGKEPCQGCGKTGLEQHRSIRTKLCPSCAEILKRGKQVNVETERKYVRFFQHFYGFKNETVRQLSYDLLDAYNNQFAVLINQKECLKYSMGSNGQSYTIPASLYDSIKNILNNLENTLDDIKNREQRVKELAIQAIADEKNEIFNEGVEMGRNLLMQLNAGSITIDQFNEPIKKY
jgi:hypothetical protein